jgi:hypothetical protein
MALCNDIKTLLSGVESTMYIGNMPDANITSVVVPTGGYNANRCLDANKIEMPTVMVHVRDLSFTAGYSRCEAIKNILDAVTHRTVGGTFYDSIRIVGDINYLQVDERGRHLFSINFIIRR